MHLVPFECFSLRKVSQTMTANMTFRDVYDIGIECSFFNLHESMKCSGLHTYAMKRGRTFNPYIYIFGINASALIRAIIL